MRVCGARPFLCFNDCCIKSASSCAPFCVGVCCAGTILIKNPECASSCAPKEGAGTEGAAERKPPASFRQERLDLSRRSSVSATTELILRGGDNWGLVLNLRCCLSGRPSRYCGLGWEGGETGRGGAAPAYVRACARACGVRVCRRGALPHRAATAACPPAGSLTRQRPSTSSSSSPEPPGEWTEEAISRSIWSDGGRFGQGWMGAEEGAGQQTHPDRTRELHARGDRVAAARPDKTNLQA